MKHLALATLLAAASAALIPAPAWAEDAKTCKAQSAEKKLAGAAQTSFLRKCETDATKACDTAAVEKKLAGAAKTSFTKKCVADATGA